MWVGTTYLGPVSAGWPLTSALLNESKGVTERLTKAEAVQHHSVYSTSPSLSLERGHFHLPVTVSLHCTTEINPAVQRGMMEHIHKAFNHSEADWGPTTTVWQQQLLSGLYINNKRHTVQQRLQNNTELNLYSDMSHLYAYVHICYLHSSSQSSSSGSISWVRPVRRCSRGANAEDSSDRKFNLAPVFSQCNATLSGEVLLWKIICTHANIPGGLLNCLRHDCRDKRLNNSRCGNFPEL